MTQEEKQLLLKDLCARLPYGVKCRQHKLDSQVCTMRPEYLKNVEDVEKYEPYLRPMSSMTKQEKYTYRHMLGATLNSEGKSIMFAYVEDFPTVIDWLNDNHFDYRGLIDNELAIEAPAGMYTESNFAFIKPKSVD